MQISFFTHGDQGILRLNDRLKRQIEQHLAGRLFDGNQKYIIGIDGQSGYQAFGLHDTRFDKPGFLCGVPADLKHTVFFHDRHEIGIVVDDN